MNKPLNKDNLPKGVHYKSSGKFEVSLPTNGVYAYFGLYPSRKVAIFVAKNHRFFAQYNMSRNGRMSGNNYWTVFDRKFSAADTIKAYNFAKKETHKLNGPIMTGENFSQIMQRKNISIDQLSKRWGVDKSVIEDCRTCDKVPVIYIDAIKYISQHITYIN